MPPARLIRALDAYESIKPMTVITKYAIAVLLAIAISASFYACEKALMSGMCGNTVFAESQAPDGKLKAVVFGRSCGATDGGSTQISILPVSVDLPNESGNICVVSLFPQVELRWAGNNELVIAHHEGATFLNAVQSFYGVTIKYESQAQPASNNSLTRTRNQHCSYLSMLNAHRLIRALDRFVNGVRCFV